MPKEVRSRTPIPPRQPEDQGILVKGTEAGTEHNVRLLCAPEGKWIARWTSQPGITPAQFLADGQKLHDSLPKSDSEGKPDSDSKTYLNFQTSGLSGTNNVVHRDMERFEEQADWEGKTVTMAHLNLAPFSLTWEESWRSEGPTLTIESSCNLPKKFAEFIAQHSRTSINKDTLEEALRKFGARTQKKQREPQPVI